MIKFFRKIRQKMLTEDKFGKYLTYAIGEIILVVIGILIALYLNNLNEQNTIHKQQENHLVLVKREMISNLKTITAEKKELTSILNEARNLLNIANSDVLTSNLTESNLSKMLASTIMKDIFIQYENGALNQIIFSGGLKDIKNDSIRKILASLEGKLNIVRLQEKLVNNTIAEVKDLLSKQGEIRIIIDDLGLSNWLELDLSVSTGSNKSLLKSKEFENILFDLFLSGNALKESIYSEFEKEIQSLIGLINQELNEK